MTTIDVLKEQEVPGTPLLLFNCTLPTGDVQYWSTHNVTVNGQQYLSRVLKHNIFDLNSSPEAATDGVSTVSITLANADSFLSSIEQNIGWKGSGLVVTFLFFNLTSQAVMSNSQVVFRGIANPPDQSTESTLRLSFTNTLNLQRVFLPAVRIQKTCPWNFPGTAAQRQDGVSGGTQGIFSPFYQCGYSPDQAGGVGNMNAGAPYTTCDYSRTQCMQRGMFDTDNQNNVTRRFGGIEFVPASIIVRTYGSKTSQLSIPLPNQALYNDFVPLIYGTGWVQPPIVLALNDGNLTHFEVLLGSGQITGVVTVIVNNTQIPVGVNGTNMTATGWYNVISYGTRNGSFNPDFSNSLGQPLGDPYGSMAFMSLVVPNSISNGTSLPDVEVLIQGLQVAQFDSSGSYISNIFSNNPAWVMLDTMLRSGWTLSQLDLPTFAAVALRCNALIPTVDVNGNSTTIPRYQCNLLLTGSRSAGDIVRGIRTGSAMYLSFDSNGLIQLNAEDTLANQQPVESASSNSTEELNGGWPAYEFGDDAFSGIVRSANGTPSLTVTSQSIANTPNQYTVEFQDEFNDYQQDSLSLVDIDDVLLTGQTVTTALTVLGLPNFDQANRAAALQLYKSVDGNTYVQFETSVKGVGLRPGDIITLTYARQGYSRQPFRITKLSPGINYITAVITAQIHDDAWYTIVNSDAGGSGFQNPSAVGIPRPLVGSVLDSDGVEQFGIAESSTESTDGAVTESLAVSFMVPAKPEASSAGIPLMGLNAQVSNSGGTLAGGQVLYYGISADDASGAEGGLSFIATVNVPAGDDTNQVTLVSLSFSPAAVSFNVYRGPNPTQILLLASAQAIAGQFIDSGLAAELQGPPDPNYDHANFYWRLELQPPEQVSIFSPTTVGSSTLNMVLNLYNGATVRISLGTGAGQEQTIASNTATALTITKPWSIQPDTTSYFLIADSTWQFGASSNASPVSFAVPNRQGVTVHVSGLSANVLDQECAYALSPLTRWTITGSTGTEVDTAVSGPPVFGLYPIGAGSVEVLGIAFASLDNTLSITAGTLTLAYWDELNGPSTILLSAAMSVSGASLSLATAVSASSGALLQIDAEVMVVQQNLTNSTTVPVTRASHGTTAVAHAVGTGVYLLEEKIFIMPFAEEFFGSPASGSYAFPITIPDVRIAAGELFMTNSKGNSSVAAESFTNTTDLGLRSLLGGQLTIQIEGPLAIQTNAAPPLVVDTSCSVRDVSAVVQDAPTGADVTMQVTQNGNVYCELTIAMGATVSNVVDGFALGPLQAEAILGLNITSVVQTANTEPGSDLTVTIRL
jgi:Putative phage tail protein